MGKDKNKKDKCRECEFYDKQNKKCEIKDITDYTKQELKECRDFMIKEDLIYY